ncbi:membrane protein [Collinsella sp. An7]|uniref:YitT family protein n=1 Tax=Collinsella sp. An7 TaxID=1965651 RepID=UPI000B38022D|nr:YitT family protein [Collinsella sp. An7]OUN48296.1 membrane protein [Collinsella sp. An7]
MATRGIARLIRSQFVHDLPLVIFGCAVAALATDMFLIPSGLAAGGVTGIATIINELAARQGINLPVGIQTIVMNAAIMLLVVRSGGMMYAVQTATGFVLYGFFTDLFAPFVVPLGHSELLVPALWGGIILGLGLGLSFRCGVSTGGSDTVAQIIARRFSLPLGTTVMVIDCLICAASAPVFSVDNALAAALSMVVTGIVVDRVVDGGNTQRAAFIISEHYEEISHDVLHGLDRGVTRIQARGEWTGEERPMLFVILDKREIQLLKAVVAERDPRAIMVITDVNEALGEGFKELGA